MAVPQSGPIRRRPLRTASCLRAISSSIETLSEKTMTCMSALRAFRASYAAYSPGTETRARLAPGRACSPPSRPRGRGPSVACDVARRARSSASFLSAASSTTASAARSATTRSVGARESSVDASNPMPVSNCRFAGVASTTCPSCTPSIRPSSAEMDMRKTESRYVSLRTINRSKAGLLVGSRIRHGRWPVSGKAQAFAVRARLSAR